MESPQGRWYQSATGIMLVGLGATIVLVVCVVIGLMLYYTWLIKNGKEEKIVDAFTALSSQNAVPAVVVNRSELEVSGIPLLGSATAPITIVEFVDFKCPNCKAAAPILERVAGLYGKDVKIMVRHFPIESLHPGASRLSLFAECANEQNAFWPAYHTLYARQDQFSAELNDDELSELASALSLNLAKLKTCLTAPKTNTAVARDYSAALRFGVRGTPTFFVNGVKWEGVVPFETWKKYIESNR